MQFQLTITVEQQNPRSPLQVRIIAEGKERVRAQRFQRKDIAGAIEDFLDYWADGEIEPDQG